MKTVSDVNVVYKGKPEHQGEVIEHNEAIHSVTMQRQNCQALLSTSS